MRHRTLRGRLVYRHLDGAERGRERFVVTAHEDGARTLRAVCEIDADEVLRDVTYSVDRDYRPVDAFVRLTVREQFLGCGWFLFDEHEAQFESYTAAEGRVSQRVDVPARPRAFGSHPISADAWLTAALEADGPRQQYFDNVFVSSYAFNGAGGPLLYPMHFGLEQLGVERVTVPAGTFDCRHLRFLLEDSEVAGHPPYDLWISADDRYLCVRAIVGAPKNYLYELAELASD
jgi:hypothetical protein